jgi:hypothetical protein
VFRQADYIGGAALLLGALLVSAGTLKLVRPRAFTHAVFRLLPGKWEWGSTAAMLAPWAVGVTEVFVGAALIAGVWLPAGWRTAAAIAAAGLFVAFTAVIGYAIRRGAACGCFGSFSDGPAGGSELGRALVLAGISCSVAAVCLVSGSAVRPGPWALAWTFVLAGCVVVGADVGSEVDDRRAASDRETSGPTASGRSVAFFLGGVTSSRSGQGFPRTVRLGPRETEQLTERVRATASGQALDAWLDSRGIKLDWSTLVARRSSMRTVLGVQRYVLLTPPPGSPITLTIAIRRNSPDELDPVVTGDVDGCRLSIRRGEIKAREVGTA